MPPDASVHSPTFGTNVSVEVHCCPPNLLGSTVGSAHVRVALLHFVGAATSIATRRPKKEAPRGDGRALV